MFLVQAYLETTLYHGLLRHLSKTILGSLIAVSTLPLHETFIAKTFPESIFTAGHVCPETMKFNHCFAHGYSIPKLSLYREHP